MSHNTVTRALSTPHWKQYSDCNTIAETSKSCDRQPSLFMSLLAFVSLAPT